MEDSELSRREALHRVSEQLAALAHQRRGEITRRVVEHYESQLSRLQDLGENVEEFRVHPEDWKPSSIVGELGGVVSIRLGAPDGTEELIIPRNRFESIRSRAARFVARLIASEDHKMESQRTTAAGALEERNRALATLVDAYLENREPILVRSGDGQKRFLHPGLPKDFSPPWSAIEALHSAGKLIVAQRRTHWEINIPDSVLTETYHREQRLNGGSPGPERVERIMQSPQMQNHFYGSVYNLAQNSRDFSQTLNLGFQPGDLEGLIASLRPEILTDRGAEELRDALMTDERALGHRGVGPRLRAFLGQISIDATGQLVAIGTIQALPIISKAIETYVG